QARAGREERERRLAAVGARAEEPLRRLVHDALAAWTEVEVLDERVPGVDRDGTATAVDQRGEELLMLRVDRLRREHDAAPGRADLEGRSGAAARAHDAMQGQAGVEPHALGELRAAGAAHERHARDRDAEELEALVGLLVRVVHDPLAVRAEREL